MSETKTETERELDADNAVDDETARDAAALHAGRLDALTDYANHYGEGWQRQLFGDWMQAGTTCSAVRDRWHLLQQLRNTHGPHKLDALALEVERVNEARHARTFDEPIPFEVEPVDKPIPYRPTNS